MPKSKPEFMNVIVEEDELATRLSHKSENEEKLHSQVVEPLFNDLPLQNSSLLQPANLINHLPEGSGVVRVSQVMADFKAKQHGDRLKKMMQEGIRASRFTRMSVHKGINLIGTGNKQPAPVVREPTIIGQLSRNTNFDYLGLLDEDNKLNRKV